MKKVKKILILGASGMIGRDLYELLGQDFYVVGTYLEGDSLVGDYQLDMLDISAADELLGRLRPDLIINSTGIPSPEACELNKERAYLVNYIVAQNLSNIFQKRKIPFIYFSTDYIFSGTKRDYTETDVPNPVNYYGLTKLLGEVVSQNGLVFRLPRIIFLNKARDPIFSVIKKGGGISLDNTRPRRFLWTYDLYRAIKFLDKLGIKKGVYNVCGDDILTKYQLAELYAKINHINVPLGVFKENGTAVRPPISILDNQKIKNLGFSFTKISDIFINKLFNCE